MTKAKEIKPIELNWIEKILVANAIKIKELALNQPKNEYHGYVSSVPYKEKLTIYTKVEHVSRSGMLRYISMQIVENGEIFTIRSLPNFEKAGYKFNMDNGHDGWKMGGCGMDMGFALVYDVASFYGQLALGGYAELQKQNLDMGYSINQRWL